MHKLVCFSLDFSKKGAKFVSVLTYLGVLGPAKTPSFDSKTLLLGAKPVVSEINPNLQRKVYLGGGQKLSWVIKAYAPQNAFNFACITHHF